MKAVSGLTRHDEEDLGLQGAVRWTCGYGFVLRAFMTVGSLASQRRG